MTTSVCYAALRTLTCYVAAPVCLLSSPVEIRQQSQRQRQLRYAVYAAYMLFYMPLCFDYRSDHIN